MRNWTLTLGLLIIATTVLSCNNTTMKQDSSSTTLDSTSADSTQEIIVNPLTHAKEFPGAALQIKNITSEKVGNDSAKITVEYQIDNFNLTDQTEHSHHMANSHDGQHIHFILNNSPYVALYEPKYTLTVPINSEHHLLSFLSRSFHESIKTASAYKLLKFKVDAQGKIKNEPTPTEPSLFYSRPKGEYKGDDAKSILLDFYLVNVNIGAEEHKIKADINGQDFTLDQWIPYEVLNLPVGENIIKLSLIDKDGNALTGNNVAVERTFTIVN